VTRRCRLGTCNNTQVIQVIINTGNNAQAIEVKIDTGKNNESFINGHLKLNHFHTVSYSCCCEKKEDEIDHENKVIFYCDNRTRL